MSILFIKKKLYFCFESPVWDKCVEVSIHFKEIIRQKDKKFIEILNKIRINEIDEECEEFLKSRNIKYDKSKNNNIIPTSLYSLNKKAADRYNVRCFPTSL